jgi:hypothetical protein
MNTTVEEQIPAWYFARYGRAPEKREIDLACNWVHMARRQTRRNAEREFRGRGYSLNYQELTFGGTRVRAKLDVRNRTVFIDPGSEAELLGQMDLFGFPLSPAPKHLILAHELFHLFCPRCPAQLAELAAHLYCAEVLQLNYFPGLLDLTPCQLGLEATSA